MSLGPDAQPLFSPGAKGEIGGASCPHYPGQRASATALQGSSNPIVCLVRTQHPEVRFDLRSLLLPPPASLPTFSPHSSLRGTRASRALTTILFYPLIYPPSLIFSSPLILHVLPLYPPPSPTPASLLPSASCDWEAQQWLQIVLLPLGGKSCRWALEQASIRLPRAPHRPVRRAVDCPHHRGLGRRGSLFMLVPG